MVNIHSLLYQYKRKKPLFDGLSLDLHTGNIYGLLGRNGAGKSTLLKLISGLIFPKGGELNVFGYQPQQRMPGFLQEVFLLTEEFQLPAFTIKKYIDLYGRFYPRFDHEAFAAYLQEFQLSFQENLSGLSYGQKKKFLLAFGLATDCRLLILDEPTNGLDIPSKSLFRKLVAGAIHDERSFIISTHQVRDMENLIDPLIVLDEGEIVFYQTHDEVMTRLAATRQAELPEDDEAIYAEPFPGGYTVVTENTQHQDTNLSLELLFNAVINNKQRVDEIFKSITT